MKIMIASDIHGSLKYCRELVEKYREEKCEKLVLLGDVLYHGPRNDLPEEYNPKGVIALLNDMDEEILCVAVRHLNYIILFSLTLYVSK